jgi:UDP-3-O-[3-hydroxymyristoyl] glucosamine N-acyltransferase
VVGLHVVVGHSVVVGLHVVVGHSVVVGLHVVVGHSVVVGLHVVVGHSVGTAMTDCATTAQTTSTKMAAAVFIVLFG